MVADYWILRKRRVKLSDLFHSEKDGDYYFWHGLNWRSFAAWILGWSYLLPGFAHAVTPSVMVPEAFTNLYYLAFPLGFAVSFTLHIAINKLFPPPGLGEMDQMDEFGTFTQQEATRLGVGLPEIIEGHGEDVSSTTSSRGKLESETKVTAV